MTLRQNLFSFGVGTIGFQLMHVNISIFLQEFIFVNGKVLCWTMDYGFCKFTPWIVATTDFLSTVSLTWFFLDCRHTVPENKTHFIQSSLLSRQNIIMYIFMLNIPRLILILTNLIGTFMLKKKKVLKFWKNTSKILGMEPEGIFKFQNLSENSTGCYIFLLRSFSPIKCCSFFSAHPFLISLRFKNCISLPKQKCHLPL